MIKQATSIPTAGQPFSGADGNDTEPRGRGQLMQLFKTTSTTVMVALTTMIISAVLGVLVVDHSVAQVDLNIAQPRLEHEYQKELDKWMLRAYEGDRDAQFKVGVLFTNEQFDRPDYEQAVYWYKQAARQGHVLAQYNLGHQYLSGVGITKSDTKAMQWWLKAAKQGHALAQFNIGRAYYLGIGLSENQKQSRDWFERAARNGEPKSIEILEQLGWAEKGQYTQEAAGVTSTNNELDKRSPASSSDGQIVTQSAPATSSTIASVTEPTFASVPSSNADANKPDTISSTSTGPVANNDGATESSDTDNPETAKSPIAIYTDPSVRSVLIAIVDRRSELELIEESKVWSTVTSRVGFPVWVHGDFVNVANNKGRISGDSVNARSVPIVTNGTVVGRLNMNEKVDVLDKRDDWYRVIAPSRFKAWVKTSDFKAASESNDTAKTKAADSNNQASELVSGHTSDRKSSDHNDNGWLFKQPAESYTLQLASFDDVDKVNEFIKRGKFADDPKLHRFTAQGDDIAWTYFLYGEYKDKSAAEMAKKDIKQKRAWIRSFGRLQQNRCVAWKKQLPTPKELNAYCVE